MGLGAGGRYAHDEVPYDDMWLDDSVWLPRFLSDPTYSSCFAADFNFASEGEMRPDWKLWCWPDGASMRAAWAAEAATGLCTPGGGVAALGPPAEMGAEAAAHAAVGEPSRREGMAALLWPDPEVEAEHAGKRQKV